MKLLGQTVSLDPGTPNRKFKFVNKISHIFHPFFFFAKYELPATRIETYKFPCPHRFLLSVSNEYPRYYCKFSCNNLVSARNRRQCPAEFEVLRIYIVQEKWKSKKLQQDTGDHFLVLFLSLSFFRLFSRKHGVWCEHEGKTFFFFILLFLFEVTVYTRVMLFFVFAYSLPLFLCVYSFLLPGVARSPQPDARVPTLVINFPRLQQQDPRPLPLHLQHHHRRRRRQRKSFERSLPR